MRILAVLAVAFAACAEQGAPPSRELARAVPDYAPVAGGTLVALEGAGFAPGDRVLVAGREAAFVDVASTTRLEVLVPPGDAPGDVELVVFGATGSVSARGLFHYSSAPSITGVTPDDVVVGAASTLTVHGTGFLDEGAGVPLVLVAGQPVATYTVVDDRTLTISAPDGAPFSRPTIEIVNERGRAHRERAFRYELSATPGLLLFPRFGPSFAIFFDPTTGVTIPVPALTGLHFTSVVRDDTGAYWGVDSANRYGKLDLETQTITSTVNANTRLPAITRHAGRLYGLARFFGTGGRFGSVNAQGQFEPIGTTPLVCCGSYGLTSDGTTVWLTSRQDNVTFQIRTVDPETGDLGTPVALQGGGTYRVEELRWWNGALYAATFNGRIVTIDPQTGAITEVLTVVERVSAIAPYR